MSWAYLNHSLTILSAAWSSVSSNGWTNTTLSGYLAKCIVEWKKMHSAVHTRHVHHSVQNRGAWQAAGDCSGRSKDRSNHIRKICKWRYELLWYRQIPKFFRTQDFTWKAIWAKICRIHHPESFLLWHDRWNRTENSTNRIKDKDEWIVTEGQQPAIISKELFESAQKRFKATYKPVASAPLPLISTGFPDYWNARIVDAP